MTIRPAWLVLPMAAVLSALLVADAETVGVAPESQLSPTSAASWGEIKWPFPIDQWGTGRAFRCSAADCGASVELYLRPKLGFCNCATGVSDDAELDRVGDLELLSDKFEGLAEGRAVAVAWMQGRSRPYRVAIPYAPSRTALAIAFNDKCDVIVVTVLTEQVTAGERAALLFLNSDLVRRWAERELGL
ncbi:MAG: hypothetical protein IT537_02215 [Hyphomicrobiales bacterium]|nr:hypothetical protein [Hyphomicrobiales bacterium]